MNKFTTVVRQAGRELRPSFRDSLVKRAKWTVAQKLDDLLTYFGVRGDYLARKRLGLISEQTRSFFAVDPQTVWATPRIIHSSGKNPGLRIEAFFASRIDPKMEIGKPFTVLAVSDDRDSFALAGTRFNKGSQLFSFSVEGFAVYVSADNLSEGRIEPGIVTPPAYNINLIIVKDPGSLDGPYTLTYAFKADDMLRLIINGQVFGIFARY